MANLHFSVIPTVAAKRLLVVDDDEITLMIVEGMCRQLGVESELALGGHKRIEYFEASRFDLVLLDHHMPCSSGYQTVRWMRRIQTRNHLEDVDIVVFSAGISSRMAAELLAAGFFGVCPKPIMLADLRKLLQNGATDAKELDGLRLQQHDSRFDSRIASA